MPLHPPLSTSTLPCFHTPLCTDALQPGGLASGSRLESYLSNSPSVFCPAPVPLRPPLIILFGSTHAITPHMLPAPMRSFPPLPPPSAPPCRSLLHHTCTTLGEKAIGILFEGGKPFILSNMSQTNILGWVTAGRLGQIQGRSRADPGWIQGGSRADPGWIQGRSRADPGWIQGGSRANLGQIQGKALILGWV